MMDGACMPSIRKAWTKQVAVPGHGSQTLYLVGFDASRFEFAHFDMAGIACPPGVARSVQKRQTEYFAGRIAARHALRAAGFPETAVETGAFREPVWPEGTMGSITHVTDVAAALVLPANSGAGIGIDIEYIVPASQTDIFTNTILSHAECAYLETLAHLCPLPELQTIVFSAKESFFKAAFAQVWRYFDFDAVALVALNLEQCTLTFRVHVPLSDCLQPGTIVQIPFSRMQANSVLTICALHFP